MQPAQTMDATMSFCFDLIRRAQTIAENALQFDSNPVVSACIQADATIRAAKRQATASYYGAGTTLAAGAAALVAGIYAYRGATASVKSEQKRQEEQRSIFRLFIVEYLSNRVALLKLFTEALRESNLLEVQKFILTVSDMSYLLPPAWLNNVDQALTAIQPEILRDMLKAERDTMLVSKMMDEIRSAITYTSEELEKEANHVDIVTQKYEAIFVKLNNVYTELRFR
jgi:hypothetical protein